MIRNCTPLLLAVALLGASAAQEDTMKNLTLTGLRCENSADALLVDTDQPRFSWQIGAAGRDIRQVAWQARISEVGPDGKVVGAPLETARVESAESQWVEFPGFRPKPKSTYRWQVKVWDNHRHTSGWSSEASFTTGLLGETWPAAWIGDGIVVPNDPDVAPAARYFRKTFKVAQAPVRARLFLSAQGLVEPWLNGTKVGNEYFTPGWPDYRERAYYVGYDVTERIRAGDNTLGLILGDGWYSGQLLIKHQYGGQPLTSAFLELTDASGKVTTVSTDGTWQWANGPILANSIYHGETYDARKEAAGWARPEGCAWDWKPAQAGPAPAVKIQARVSEPVRRIEEIKPVKSHEVRPGVIQYDLGQNMVGWVRIKVKAPAGREIVVKMAEMLEPDGSLHLANLRTARATARYFARGEGVETWEPRFTYFGFRYIELSGADAPGPDAVTGVVVHSDLPRIGWFECSNPLLNQLYSNTRWGQKGNFLEVPTDCPQRNERLGWTGDAQVFSNTANYNLACGAFYRQWTRALSDSFSDGPDGGYGDVAPQTDFGTGSAGWGDAGVIVPWTTWLHTGDRRILEENYPNILRWINVQEKQAPDGIRRSRRSYGDWLAPGYEPDKAPTPYVLIATAYYARTTDLAARMADVLGRKNEAEHLRLLRGKIERAFRREFISDDGKVTSDEQTAYLMALGYGIVPAELHDAMVKHLLRTVSVKNDHIATGFLGASLVAPVLTREGYSDLAYKILLQETYPGWLFSVKNGATTIWERWDSWTPKDGFNSAGMNSFNHYAYGAIVEWFYDTVTGLKPSADGAGWKEFDLAPKPGGGLTYANARINTPYGPAASDWKIANGRFAWKVTIPANTTARVRVPVADAAAVTADGKPLSALAEAKDLKSETGAVTLRLSSGTYEFSAPWKG